MVYIQEYSDGKGQYGFKVIDYPDENLEKLEMNFNEEKIFYSQNMYIIIKEIDVKFLYIVSTIYSNYNFDYETITIYSNYNDMISTHSGFLNDNHYNTKEDINKYSKYCTLYII